jgi:hypothetical protein
MNRATAEPLIATEGVIIGRLVCISESGQALVSFAAGASQSWAARSCVPLMIEQIGREVVIVFEGGSQDKPIVVGVLEPPGHAERHGNAEHVTARVDGARVVIAAKNEIVLECGEASITLTRAGKILIRGAYVSTHSSGVHRIKGATVEIN